MPRCFLVRLGALAFAGLLLVSADAAAAAQLNLAQQRSSPPQAQPQAPPGGEPGQDDPGEEQQQFLDAVRELLAPALDGVTSFAPDPDNPEVIRIETSDPNLPLFYANLIEEESAYSPEQTVEQIRGGFSACRDERAAARRTQNSVTMASFTLVCRTEDGEELQMFVITMNDADRTQAMMLGSPVRHGPALIARGQRVFQGLTGGSP